MITDRRYIGHEDDTGYHHYAMDVAKLYGLEEMNYGYHWSLIKLFHFEDYRRV